jgi:hypothetical protein
MKTKLHLKQSMSCLRDVGIDVDIDHEQHAVKLTMATFDSAWWRPRWLESCRMSMASWRTATTRPGSPSPRHTPYSYTLLARPTALRSCALINGSEFAVTLGTP